MSMPLMIDLTNKNVVIVGGGTVASRRAQTLSQYVEHMTVISPTITEKLQNMVDKGVVIWKGKEFEPSDIVDAYLVIAATNEPRVNEAVKQALPEHALFNNVGDASNGNVVFPSALHRDKLTISVSTDGASPKLTKSIMAELEALYPPSYSSYIDFLYTCRQKIKLLDITYNEKQQLLSQIVSQEYLNHDKQAQFLVWLDVRQ
ncbi:TPA: NAD(P)-binding protein [Staphylococcus aureus]|uniref:NAD(P)-binding protein n=1 Tax=Staphylococcus aureus TaxID=1280 RepID=UPI0001C0B73F|nr:NAD(P)-binding protein [Staphylococcus aureus]EFB56803.1 precorrin-2 dehydrogenase [Staphylococcus aureus subsp. aureus WW2703/97]EFC27806.1 putative siroheme synthase [Staphylococcus aureus subsp. aureus A017934/97]ENM62092.1 siroheme synthase domain-containing protein [Staphylococcus aureus M1256]MBU7412963.1 NAD(P)-binding protein [Staphylococcus aureus]QNZ31119.1 NAD(P)-binding protein [Staphylococcus aureus]